MMPPNFEKDPIHVKHSELTRLSDASLYRVECPVCDDGILLVMREQEPPFKLQGLDRCVSCGQAFIYDDIDKMRGREDGQGA
jgi:hypothetical protein